MPPSVLAASSAPRRRARLLACAEVQGQREDEAADEERERAEERGPEQAVGERSLGREAEAPGGREDEGGQRQQQQRLDTQRGSQHRRCAESPRGFARGERAGGQRDEHHEQHRSERVDGALEHDPQQVHQQHLEGERAEARGGGEREPRGGWTPRRPRSHGSGRLHAARLAREHPGEAGDRQRERDRAGVGGAHTDPIGQPQRAERRADGGAEGVLRIQASAARSEVRVAREHRCGQRRQGRAEEQGGGQQRRERQAELQRHEDVARLRETRVQGGVGRVVERQDRRHGERGDGHAELDRGVDAQRPARARPRARAEPGAEREPEEVGGEHRRGGVRGVAEERAEPAQPHRFVDQRGGTGRERERGERLPGAAPQSAHPGVSRPSGGPAASPSNTANRPASRRTRGRLAPGREGTASIPGNSDSCWESTRSRPSFLGVRSGRRRCSAQGGCDMAKKKSSKSRKKAARKGKAKPARARAKKAASGSPIEALARKIVRATSLPVFPLRELYTDNAVSEEATGDVSRGIAGLEDKLKRWEQMQAGTKWKARNVWFRGNTICIEWDAQVTMRDGRTVQLREIGVHEIKGGKIAAERFYYNPMQLAPPQAAIG